MNGNPMLAAQQLEVTLSGRTVLRDVSLFPARGADRIRPVFRESTHGKQITAASDHFGSHIAHKVGCVSRNFGDAFNVSAYRGFGNGNLVKVSKSRINCREVLPHDRLSSFAIGFSNELLDLRDRFIARQDAAQCKEAGLHDCIDAISELTHTRHTARINCIDLQSLVDDRSLDGRGQMIPHFRLTIGTVD